MLSNASVATIKTDCHVTAATTSKEADGVSRVSSISVACEPEPVAATVVIDASCAFEVPRCALSLSLPA